MRASALYPFSLELPTLQIIVAVLQWGVDLDLLVSDNANLSSCPKMMQQYVCSYTELLSFATSSPSLFQY